MNGSQDQMIAQIKTAIADGTLPYSEMKRRLMLTIDTELNKTDGPADIGLVKACQSLLCETHTHGQEFTDSARDKNLAAIESKIRKQQRRQTVQKTAVRAVAIAAALAVLTLGADILLRRQWLEGHSTETEQDYVIQAQVVDPGMVQSGTADDEDEFKEVKSTDFDEAISILSFTPPVPTWVPEGWELFRYHSLVFETDEKFLITYQQNGAEKFLLYEVQKFFGSDSDFSMHAEQNGAGDKEKIDNGQNVYFGMNLELPACVWYQNNMAFVISGPLTKHEMIQMINSNKGA